MNWKAFLIAAIIFASALTSRAVPVTFKEISMLLRNGEHQQFIFSEAERRKLLQPLSRQEEAALTAVGATPALLNALRSPTLLAPPEAVAAYKARIQKLQESSQPAPEEEAPRAIAVAPPPPRVPSSHGVRGNRNGQERRAYHSLTR